MRQSLGTPVCPPATHRPVERTSLPGPSERKPEISHRLPGSFLFEGCVEGDGAGREVEVADELAGLLRPVLPLHAAVLPFD